MFSSRHAKALWLFLCLLPACKSHRSEATISPIQVTVQPDPSKTARLGDLCITMSNRSTEDLLFRSDHVPWEVNAGGIDFVIYREDGSVVTKTPMIADPMVGTPVLLKRGEELSHRMSLLVYYVELPKELALHDLKVSWLYVPRPTNSVVAGALRGEVLLKKLPVSAESRGP